MRRFVLVAAGVTLGSLLLASSIGTTAASFDSPLVVSSLLSSFPMEAFLAHWWVFPASILFSTIALASGVSGALFFSPFFLLVVGLQPAQAIGAGLLTEVFGMGNGLRSYVKQGLVDYAAAKWLLLGAVPSIIVGAFAAQYAPEGVLRGVFGVGLVVLGGFLVYYEPPDKCVPGEGEGPYLERKNTGRGKTVVEAADGERYVFDTCWRPPGVALATTGGFITGLISAGLPEIVTTQLVIRCRVPPRVAIATSVFVLAVAAVAGAAVHALSATPVWYVVAWSIPGVLIGGTIGTRVGKYVPSDLMEAGLGVIFVIVGGIVLVTTFLL
nr:sulfite exporter TauE/SafE family protein [Natronorubrum thiooxidans]